MKPDKVIPVLLRKPYTNPILASHRYHHDFPSRERNHALFWRLAVSMAVNQGVLVHSNVVE